MPILTQNFVGINPVSALFWTAVINGLVSPPVLVRRGRNVLVLSLDCVHAPPHIQIHIPGLYFCFPFIAGFQSDSVLHR